MKNETTKGKTNLQCVKYFIKKFPVLFMHFTLCISIMIILKILKEVVYNMNKSLLKNQVGLHMVLQIQVKKEDSLFSKHAALCEI